MNFSGGMRQRVLIAAAIALRPRLLIADEPTSALDVTVQKQVLDLLDQLRAETGMGVLFITHDLAVAGERADELVVMHGGLIVESGPAGRASPHPSTEYASRLITDAPALQTKARPALAEAAARSAHPFVSVESLTHVFDRTGDQVSGVEDVDFTGGPRHHPRHRRRIGFRQDDHGQGPGRFPHTPVRAAAHRRLRRRRVRAGPSLPGSGGESSGAPSSSCIRTHSPRSIPSIRSARP